MSNRSVNVELPDEVWKVIDTQFKPLMTKLILKYYPISSRTI